MTEKMSEEMTEKMTEKMTEEKTVSLQAEEILRIHADCPERIVVGSNDWGYLRAILIKGGTVSGRIKGEIVPGGADWNMALGGEDLNSAFTADLFAKYLLKTEDGVYIAVENRCRKLRTDAPSYISTTPIFFAPRGPYEWLNYGVYVANLVGFHTEESSGVDIIVYRMC